MHNNLTEKSLEKMVELLSAEALQALDMVDRNAKAIDWERWYSTFTCLEALGLIVEAEETWAQVFVHKYTFTILGARVWKFYIQTQIETQKAQQKLWWNSLIFSK